MTFNHPKELSLGGTGDEGQRIAEGRLKRQRRRRLAMLTPIMPPALEDGEATVQHPVCCMLFGGILGAIPELAAQTSSTRGRQPQIDQLQRLSFAEKLRSFEDI